MNEGEKTGFSNGRVFSFLISKRGRCYLLFAVAVAALVNALVATGSADALYFQGWTSQHINNEAQAQGVHKCYSKTNGRKGMDIYSFDFSASSTQIQKTIEEKTDEYVPFTYKSLFPNVEASPLVFLPNGLGPVTTINCANLINHFDDTDLVIGLSEQEANKYSDSVYERLGVPSDKFSGVKTGAEGKLVNDFMTGMGYSSTTSTTSVSRACYAIKYRADQVSIDSLSDAYSGKWNNESTTKTIFEGTSQTQVCASVGSDGKITSLENDGWPTAGYMHGGEYFLAYARAGSTEVHFEIWAYADYGEHDKCGDYGSCVDYMFGYDCGGDYACSGWFDAKGKTLEQFETSLTNVIAKIRYTTDNDIISVAPMCEQGGWPGACIEDVSFKQSGIGIYGLGYEKTSDAAGEKTWTLTGNGNDALKFISDNSTLDSKIKAGFSWSRAGITNSEKALLYQWYMANPAIAGANINCNPTEEELKLHPDWTHQVEWFDDMNTKRTCYVTSFPTDDVVGYVLVDKDGHFNDYYSSIYDLMDAMQYGFNVLTDVDPNDIISSGEAQEAFDESLLPSGTPKEDCFSGAGSMGWLICPIIFDLGKLVQDRYAAWVEPALQIDTLLFGNNDGSPAYAAWNVFRTIANLAFVIVFLVIIFSQLTGVGVDNYGIKKILPKLIVGAILINLSYIVCQLAIDIANIIGYGIAGLFQWISSQINSGIPPQIKVEGAMVNPGKEGLLGDGVAGMGAIVVLIVGVLTTASVLSQGTALVIPVLMAVLGVSFSFFALIAILGIRQAAAVILVVASPLAFVCYMLPNTKKIFDKWFKALQGLLIAFPACSALVYGGDMVGRILLSTSYGSTWILISAAVVSVAPIFFIPKLIRGSMGAVSNTIANVSSGLGRKARDAGNNSRLAKDIRASHDWAQQRRINLRRAGLDENYQETERGRRRRERAKKGSYAQINMARARAAVLRDYSETAEANRMAGEEGIALLNNKRYGVDEKLNNADIAAAESQLKFGQMTMTGIDKNGKEVQTPIDPNSIDQLKQALVEAIIKGEDTKQKALVNALTKRGDDGREAVHGAIEESERAAQQMNSEEIRKLRSTHKSLASHIMDNFASTYKNNNRSTYDWAARNQTESQAFNNEFLGGKREWMAKNSLAGRHMSVNNVKGTSLLNMDDQEFRRLADSHSSMSDTEKEDLTRAITVALHSNAASTADLKRIEDLQNLMKNLGKS